jgi:MOSC domain-containing protein YiiM
MTATIEQIFSAAGHGEPQSARAEAQLVADVGLDGDRYAGTGVISLIQAEAVEAFNAATGLSISPAATGRNLVTRGIALNPLVGKRFKIGEVELEGTELCDPCATLGKLLATEQISAAAVVRNFTDTAGVRARVLSTGSIAAGTVITDNG